MDSLFLGNHVCVCFSTDVRVASRYVHRIPLSEYTHTPTDTWIDHKPEIADLRASGRPTLTGSWHHVASVVDRTEGNLTSFSHMQKQASSELVPMLVYTGSTCVVCAATLLRLPAQQFTWRSISVVWLVFYFFFHQLSTDHDVAQWMTSSCSLSCQISCLFNIELINLILKCI